MAKSNYSYALLAATALFLAGCGNNPPAQNMAQAQYSNDDASINNRVRVAVDNVEGVHPNDITTQTKDAVVTFRGAVDNRRSAEKPVKAARRVRSERQREEP